MLLEWTKFKLTEHEAAVAHSAIAEHSQVQNGADRLSESGALGPPTTVAREPLPAGAYGILPAPESMVSAQL